MNCFRRTSSSHRCSVVLLDGMELSEEITDDTLGQELLDGVLRRLNIRETSYFGLRYVHASRQPHWLHPNKKISKQLKGTSPFTLYFCVKFYATDPCKLRDEITRYQFFLQVRKDMVDGRLPVPTELAAELSGCIAQSELGDYDPSSHGDGYCRQFQLNPGQPAPEETIAALHKALKGRCPAEAEAALLEKVRWLDMYGADLHPVMVSQMLLQTLNRGENNAETFVGLAPSGMLVIRGKGRLSNHFWPRITKVFCKKNCLVVLTRDNNNEEQTLSFRCASRLASQLLLQTCLEHQEFSRHALANPPAANTSKGSRSDGRRGSSASSSQRQRGRRETNRLASTDPDQLSPASDGDALTPSTCHKSVSIPQPVQSVSSLYRAGSVTMETKSPAGSPRSVHSALLSSNQMASLFNTKTISKSRSRTSVDSQSSADSRTQRRNRHRRDHSAGSDVSSGGSSVRSSRRYRNRRPESGSDSDRSGGSRRHRSRRHRHQTAAAGGDELVDSEPQWREVQRLQAERLRPSGYQNSGMETETELSYQPKRRVKRHSRSRSRSRSPETNRNRRLPVELRRHLQFGLVEPPADPAADLQYTRVTTEHRLPRVKYATKRSQKGGSVDGRSDVASEPQQEGTPSRRADRALPPTAAYPAPPVAYPAPAAAYPAPAATYTAPGVPYPAPAATYPAPATLQQPVRPAAAGHHTRTPAGERSRETAIANGRESSQAAVTSGHPRLTSGQLTLPTDSQYDNSDSGLGNESPTEFTRLSAQTSLPTGPSGPRVMTSQGEPRAAVRTLDTVTSL